MSSLDRLVIRGIRSFDNNAASVVEFQTPVTVIVGSNGTGKTTIIECLKYATTGELPPNTKGGAFVHDPKMAGEKEVRAQVKLRFLNTAHERMVVTRNLSVSVKKSGLTMKTLETVLAKDEVGESNYKRNTISSKCSEINEEAPKLLGVSQAILDNVIFCHQEESNWPLSEPGKLKVKFDEIFEATKYTDALDAIKKDRKERTAELKVERERLNHLKLEKVRAETYKTKIAGLETKVTKTQSRADELNAEATEMAAINLDFREKAEQFMEVFNKQEQLMHQITTWEEQVRSYEDGMTLLKETEDELELQKKDFEKGLQEKRRLKTTMENKKSDAEDRLRMKEKDLSGLLQRKGQLDAELQAHEESTLERAVLVKTICLKFKFTGYNFDALSHEHVVEVTEKLRSKRKVAENELRKLKAAGKEDENKLLAKLTELNSTKASATGIRSNLKSQTDDLERQVRRDDRDSQDLSSRARPADVKRLQDQAAEIKTLISESEKTLEEGRFDETKRNLRAEINALEQKREGLVRDLKEIQVNSEARTKVGLIKSSLEDKEAQMAGIVDAHNETHRELVGKDINRRLMDRDVAKVTVENEEYMRRVTAEKAELDRRAATQKANLRTELEKINEKKAEQSAWKTQKRELLATHDVESIEEAVTKVQLEIKGLRNLIQTAEQFPVVFEHIKTTAEKKHVCFGCNRSLEKQEEVDFYDYIATIMSNNRRKDDTRRWQQEVEGYEKSLVELRRMEGVEASMKAASEDLPKMGENFNKRKAACDQMVKQAKDAQEELDRLKAEQTGLITLKENATLMSRIYQETETLGRELADLEEQISGGSSKTPEDLEPEIEKADRDLKHARSSLATATESQERVQGDLHKHKSSLSRLDNDLLRLEQQLQNLRDVQARLADAQERLEKLSDRMKDVDASIAQADAPIKQLQAEIEKVRQQHGDEVQSAEEDLGTIHKQTITLDRATAAVEKWDNDDGHRRLREVQEETEEKEYDIKGAREEVGKLEKEVKEVETSLYQADKTRKNIDDNIRHRQYKARIRTAKEEIKDLSVEESTEARKQYERKYTKSKQKEQDLVSQHAMLQGEISSFKAQISELKETLTSEYKNITPEYQVKLMDVKAAELANIDLERYSKALDMGVMSYHSVKMAEINASIGYLWNRTYQGTDIDTIMIKSDSDEAKTTTTTRRSYNYRVVMVKDQVEMDMRGRCSAGQKVLASIIIRLALSDSFGTNCGIIALDEPTTNLDKENIASLAQSLAMIIEDRRQSGNFQLVVITHDETFLREIAAEGDLDVYMRVSRDANQKSVVNRFKTSTLG